MKNLRLADLTEPVSTWQPNSEPDAYFDYIDLSAVDNEAKCVRGVTGLLGSEAPSRARQIVFSGDILVSTVRPNLNAVAVIDPDLHGATVSTGFTVLRPKAELLDGRYLFHWVRTEAFVGSMVRQATGASYPAVSDRIVKGSAIPIPPIAEQRRIAAILDQADALGTKRRQVLAHLDDLTQSIFHDMFGAPGTWPQRWSMGTISEMAESVQYGTAAKAGDEGRLPILRMGNLTDGGRLDTKDLKFIDLSESDVAKFTTQRGDLLFNRTNSLEKVGKSAVVRTAKPYAIAGYLIRVRLKHEHNPEFVSAYLSSDYGRSLRREVAKLAVNQANISASELRRIPIALPPGDLQHEFASRLARVERQRDQALKALDMGDGLLTSLQSRAFRGDL